LSGLLERPRDERLERIDVLPTPMLGVEIRLPRETGDQLQSPRADAAMRDRQAIAPDALAIVRLSPQRGLSLLEPRETMVAPLPLNF
jgi:hypothetical protein